MKRLSIHFIYFTRIAMVLSLISLKSSASDSMYCLNAVRYFEKKHNIPNNLLYSISLVESGRWDKKLGRKAPWPWSLNVNGKSMFFTNKKKMMEVIKSNIDSGNYNIDIGCNQINYRYHKDNFKNLEQIASPFYNVQYSADYLQRHFENTKNWEDAVALYHSKDIAKNQKYIKKIQQTAAKNSSLMLAWQKKKKNNNTKSSSIPKINNKAKEEIMIFDVKK